jgi:HEAT repeat protein
MVAASLAVVSTLAIVGAPPQAAPSDAVRARWLAITYELAADDPARRERGAAAAGLTGSPYFLDPLRAALHDTAPGVRRAAATALGALGVPRTSDDLVHQMDALFEAAEDTDLATAHAAVQSLGRYPFLSVRQRLVELSTDPRPPIRAAATQALSARPGDEAQRRLADYFGMTQAEIAGEVRADDLHLRPLLGAARVLLSETRSTKPAAAQTLAGWADFEETRPLLIRALAEPDAPVRATAAKGLGRDPDPAASAALVRSLRDPDDAVRLQAIAGLASRDETAKALAIHLAREPSAALRVRVARALDGLPEAPTLAGIAAWPHQTPASSMRLAVDVLEAKTSSASTQALVDVFMRARAPSVVSAAKEAVARRSDGATVPPLLGHLHYTKPRTERRRRIVEALAKRTDPRVTEALLGLVAAGEVDGQTIAALHSRPEALVRPRLLELVTSDRAGVRRAALEGVRDYRGEDVADALGAAVKKFPNDEVAFDQLLEQDKALTLGTRVALLEEPTHSHLHRGLLLSIHDAVDPAIPGAVVQATQRDPKLAPLALEILDRQADAESAGALYAIAADEAVADSHRANAVRRMAKLEDASIESRLRPLANDEALVVRMTARNALHDLQPQTYPAWDPYGRVPLIVEGAAFGAGMMLLATEIADADLSPAFTGGVGMLLGGATPFLLTLEEDVTLGDAGYFGTMGLWGTGAGYGLGKRLGVSESTTLWLTVAGEAAGIAAGSLGMKRVEWGLDDVALANFTAVESAILTAGITALARRNADDRGASAMEAGLIGGAVGTIPMALFARRLKISHELPLAATAMTHGAWLGMWAPAVLEGELSASDAAAGALVGQSIGYLTALGLAQFVSLDGETAAYSGFGAATGAAIGGGLGLVLDNRSTATRVGLLEAGSAVGALTLAIVGPSLEWNENDATIVALAALGGAISGGQLSVRLEEGTFDEPAFPGGMLMGAGIGTAAGIVASQLVDVSDKSLTNTLVGAGVLGAGGVGLGYLVGDLDVRARSNISGAAIGLGLAMTYPLSDALALEGKDYAYAGVGASLGGLYGGFVPVYFDGDAASSQIAGGVALGSAVGGYGAAIASHWLDLSAKRVAVTSFSSVAASSLGAGLGLLIPSASDELTVGMMQGAGFATFATLSVLLSNKGLSLKRTDRVDPGGELVMAAAMLGAQGAFQGGLIPYMWNGDGPPASEVTGGVMVGASAGALGGLALHYISNEPIEGGHLVEASLLGVAANGLGAGLGLVTQSRRTGASLMQGLGLTTYVGALALAPRTNYDERAPATFFTSSLTLGWLGGWAPMLLDDPESSQVIGGALAGSSAGVLGAVALVELYPRRDDVEIAAGTAIGSGLGAGLGLMIDRDATRGTVALLEAGGLLGLGAGLALGPVTTYDDGDRALAAYGTLAGGALGGFLPRTWTDENVDTAGGALFGASLGAAVAMTTSQFVTVDPKDVVEMSIYTSAMSTAGGGIALLADLDSRQSALALEIAALGGVALGAVVAPYTKYGFDEMLFAMETSAVGGAHGAQLGMLLEDEAGGSFLGASAGLLAGALVSQVADVKPTLMLEAAAFTGVGDLFGYGIGRLATDDPNGQRAWIGGLGLSAYTLGLAVGPFTSYEAEDYLTMTLASGVGAWHGAWLPALFAPEGPIDRDRAGAGAAVGAASGVLLGAVTSQFVDVPVDVQVEMTAGWATGSAIGAGLGLLLPSVDRKGTIGLMQGGGALGLAASLALADSLEYEAGDALLVPAGAAVGAAVGLTLPALILDPNDPIGDNPRAGGVLLGAGIGTIAAATAAQFVQIEAGDVAEASAASMLGAATGLGVGMMIPGSNRRGRFLSMDLFGVAGLGLGTWLAPKMDVDEDAVMSMALGSTLGGLAGGFTPSLFNGPNLEDIPGEQAGGGVLAGVGLGAATGLLLDQTLELDATTREHAAYGAAMSGMAGAGFSMLASEDDRWLSVMGPSMAIAGAFAVGATSKHASYDAGDLALGSAYVGYLTWHAMGLTLLSDGTNRQAAGVAMGTVGLGALTGMYLTPYIDLTMSDVLMLTAGNVWGTWIGGWGGVVLREQLDGDFDGRRGAGLTLLTSVLGSDVGLAVTGMVVGGLLDVEPTRFAVINLSGLGGMMVGMLAAGALDDEPLRTGNVLGSLGGLVVGAVVTSFFDWKSSPTWDELLGEDEAKAAEAKAPSGKSGLGVQEWFPGARIEPTEDGAGERYLFTIGGTWN